jgi:hypothetical protein
MTILPLRVAQWTSGRRVRSRFRQADVRVLEMASDTAGVMRASRRRPRIGKNIRSGALEQM